jgi:hypothetical protein
MTTAYTSLLGLALPVTGELSGTWGDTVNNYITGYLDAAVAGTNTLSTDADVTLTKTTNASLNGTSSQYAVILWTAGGTATRTIIAPSASSGSRQFYIVINKTSSTQSIKLCGTGPTTGVTVTAGTSAICAWNGSDFVQIGAGLINLATGVTGTLPVANGGTGSTTLTANNVLLGNGTSALQAVAPGTSGNVLTSNGTTWASTAPSGVTLGTAVTCVSQSNIDYTSLPSGLKRITVAFNEVACGGNILIQLGTSSGFETTGYVSTSTQLDNVGASAAISSTTGICAFAGGPNLSGVYVICSLGSNIWSASMVGKCDTIRTTQAGGAKTLGGTLDRIRITTTNGTTYTSGIVNILYE